MTREIEASFEAEWIDELRKEAEELHREVEERREMAMLAKVREKAANIIAICFTCSAVLMIGMYDGTDKLFVITLIALLISCAITCRLVACGFHEEAKELGYGRDPWEH